MPTTIRPAVVEDLQPILSLEQQVPGAAHWSIQEYQARLNGVGLLVATMDTRLCGFLCARLSPGGWEIENVVVGEEFRRQGIADALLQALIDTAEKAGNPDLHLEVRGSNLPARRLYEKHGFRQVGKRPGYYRDPSEDAVLYALRRQS
jgi:ribosomal-protein-alanine N-acetyltransferase